MTIVPLPRKQVAISMVLGLAIIVACVGFAIPDYAVAQRRLASLEERIEGVDRRMHETGQRRTAGRHTRESAASEQVRLAASRDSLMTALRTLAEQRADDESNAYSLLGGCLLGLLLLGHGHRENATEGGEERAWRTDAELLALYAQQPGRAPRSSGGVDARGIADPHDDARLDNGDCLTARHGAFDREPQELRHALMRIRHLTGEHVAVPRDLQLRAAHAIVDSDSPEAALRALRVSGVLHVLDRAGANTTRLTGAIPEIWHRSHLD